MSDIDECWNFPEEMVIESAHITNDKSYFNGAGEKILPTHKAGMYCNIPYIQILGYQDRVIAEYCLHNIIGVTYRKK